MLVLDGALVAGCSCGGAIERTDDAAIDATSTDAGADVGRDAAPSPDTGSDVGVDAALACDEALTCDDDDPCNGTELCIGGFCASGTGLPDGSVCRTSGKGATCLAGRCVPNP